MTVLTMLFTRFDKTHGWVKCHIKVDAGVPDWDNHTYSAPMYRHGNVTLRENLELRIYELACITCYKMIIKHVTIKWHCCQLLCKIQRGCKYLHKTKRENVHFYTDENPQIFYFPEY